MKLKNLILFSALVHYSSFVLAQTELKKPEVSQAAAVNQRIGLTDINITYHSPLAKGRVIWGELVPYNEVWRAGANENTTISFSTDVKIEGKLLPSGSYGLHLIPTQKEWTVIFSNKNYAWGSFFYAEKDDAVRVTVNPKVGTNQDWLSYNFSNPQAQSTTVELHWEKLIVPFNIEVDVPETVFESMRKELANINGFFWQGHNQAAAYCIKNNIHLDVARTWIDKSIGIQKNFTNLTTKSKLLDKQGNNAAAEDLRKEALTLADEAQLNAHGYELLAQNNSNEAITVFKLNVKRYPASWNVYDSLAEALEGAGDKKGAIANYKTALSKAPEAQRKRIETTIKKLEGKS